MKTQLKREDAAKKSISSKHNQNKALSVSVRLGPAAAAAACVCFCRTSLSALRVCVLERSAV